MEALDVTSQFSSCIDFLKLGQWSDQLPNSGGKLDIFERGVNYTLWYHLHRYLLMICDGSVVFSFLLIFPIRVWEIDIFECNIMMKICALLISFSATILTSES